MFLFFLQPAPHSLPGIYTEEMRFRTLLLLAAAAAAAVLFFRRPAVVKPPAEPGAWIPAPPD